jgi:hypothetical protein
MHLLEIARTQTDNKEAFYQMCLRVLLPHRCHASPIVQPAFWPAVIPPQYTPSEVYTRKASMGIYLHVYEVHACEMHVYEVHAHEMHAHEMHACTCKIHVYEVYAAVGAYLGGTRLGDVRL